MADVPDLQSLINTYAGQGIMLPRSLSSLYERLRDYIVAEHDGRMLGCVALHVAWRDLAEIRSLAVSPEAHRTGLGTRLVEAALEDARNLGAAQVFVLTYVPAFFRLLGFKDAEKSALPHKIWADCVQCIHFPDCDEVALILEFEPSATETSDVQMSSAGSGG
jgi:amino-acid N-acetyltransferase